MANSSLTQRNQIWFTGGIGLSPQSSAPVSDSNASPYLYYNSSDDTVRLVDDNAVETTLLTTGGSVMGVLRVRAATTAALAAGTYSNGTLGVGATFTVTANGALAAQDGVTLTAGQRLLVKDQASGFQNGIYEVTTVGDGSTQAVITRVDEFDTTAEIKDGQIVEIQEGSTYAGWAMKLTTNTATPVTVGTTNLTFERDTETVNKTGAQTIAGQKTFSAAILASAGVDQSAAAALTLGPTTATSVNIGAAAIPTNLLGNVTMAASKTLTVNANVLVGAVADKLNPVHLAHASQVIGDILYADTATTMARLADVAVGSYLRSGGVGTAPVWSTVTLPNAGTRGDLIYASAANVYSQLAVGAVGKIIRSDGTDPVYSTATFPDTVPGAGQILRASGANAWGYSTATWPTDVAGAGKILRASGASTWAESTATYPDTPSAVGDLLVATGAAAYGHVSDVAVGQVLTSGGVGTAPAYAAVTGTHVANVADEQTAPGIQCVHVFDIADAAGNTDITIDKKFEIADITVIKTTGAGGAGDTVQITDGTNAITEAISINLAAAKTARPTDIDTAYSAIAASGTLRATIVDGNAGATDLSCRVFVRGVLRA